LRFFFFTVDDQLFLSGRLNRYLRWAAWAVIALFIACSFLLYCSYLTITGAAATPLRHLSVQLVIGAVGAAGALGGIFLSEAMWTYWRVVDSSTARFRRVWFLIMTFVPMFGCAAYYFAVYDPGLKGQCSL
jgi:nitrate/nitrite transporter NarK